ncbi:la-related protein 1 [Geosmithia morbida]|uniref:La-related protein 1 n=1 Tax=Geosmithia morbida TaxID=1094350 RepID=A0A9P4YVS3_9HYPO|nr:la-related protein 1 [Geosmithia morbida]KAF4122621.1 la-related protein 1 [Geosmithia morbida]
MAAASSFSYAQAAKGQGGPTAHPTSPSTQPADQAVAAPIEELQPTKQNESPDVPVEATPKAASSPAEPTNQEAAPAATAGATAEGVAVDVTETTVAPATDAKMETVQSRRSDPKKDEDAARLDRPWRRNDKSTRSSSAATRSVDEHDSRRPRKGKKAKSSDAAGADSASSVADQEQKEEPEAPKVELSEAPLPTVNIWQQRKQAQQAKAKPEPATNGVSAAGAADAHHKPAHVNGGGSGPKGQSKSSDKPERNGSRGNRAPGRGKENRPEAPPLVEDASSWPTPETAIQEDKKKATTPTTAATTPATNAATATASSDKPASEDGAQAKPRQKKEWVAYDYVPTVSFETQLPQMRGSKPRGGAKGGAGSRSAANAAQNSNHNGDKAAAAAATGAAAAAPSAANTNTSASKPGGESRDRTREPSGPAGRNTSLPPTNNKRASIDVANTKGEHQKKPDYATNKAKDAAPGQQVRRAPVARPPHHEQDTLTQNQQPPHQQQHPVREGRPERASRGAYRGRGGGHNAISSHGQHQHSTSATAPPFQSSGNNPSIPIRATPGPYSPPPRQGHGQGFMPPSQRGGGRGGRGGANNYNRMSLPNGGAARMPPVQAQFAPYDYSMQQQMQQQQQQIPFQQQNVYFDSMVVPMLRSQIEYYFSIENLCKDLYLRQRMDSQGFVPLLFIAAFKRMRDLSPDLGLIRAVCEESGEIDFVVADDDGSERLRRRVGWDKFVLPMHERDDMARNDGPRHITWKSRSFTYQPAQQQQHQQQQYANGMVAPPSPYGMASPPAYQGVYPDDLAGGPNGYVNGYVNGHGGHAHIAAAPATAAAPAASQLSAAVPDFNPSGALSSTNGHAATNGATAGDRHTDAIES